MSAFPNAASASDYHILETGTVDELIARADACFVERQGAQAETYYRRVLALDPAQHEAINNLGILLAQRAAHAEAEQIFRQILAAAPDFQPAHQNLAQLLVASGRMPEALALCRQGQEQQPENPAYRQLLGEVYGALGMHTEARELYAQWLADDPDNAAVQHQHAAYSGDGVPPVASNAYVRATFDPFAIEFEQKLAALEYRAPALVGEALARLLSADAPPGRVLDAGCGTGLCAPYLRPYARALVGVDLSGPMLDLADEKALYDILVEQELVAFLEAYPATFDVIVSADTLCYFGQLEAFARAARQSLDGRGWLVFTVEALAPDGTDLPWQLQPTGRYAHQRLYVEDTLREHGFAVCAVESVRLRVESGQPVMGWLVSAECGTGA